MAQPDLIDNCNGFSSLVPLLLISTLEAIARVSYDWHPCLCIYSPDLVFSFFVVAVAVSVAVAVVRTPMAVKPFLEPFLIEHCTMY